MTRNNTVQNTRAGFVVFVTVPLRIVPFLFSYSSQPPVPSVSAFFGFSWWQSLRFCPLSTFLLPPLHGPDLALLAFLCVGPRHHNFSYDLSQILMLADFSLGMAVLPRTVFPVFFPRVPAVLFLYCTSVQTRAGFFLQRTFFELAPS